MSSFRPYFLEPSTSLQQGLMTAAQSLGGAIQQQAQRGVFEKALLESGLDPVKAAAFAGIAGISPGAAQEVSRVATERYLRGLGSPPKAGVTGQPVRIEDRVNVDEQGNKIVETQDAQIRFQGESGYNPFENLLPKEKIKLQDDFRKASRPFYLQNSEKLVTNKKFAQDLKLLNNLSESGQLPEGLGQFLNVDAAGNLRIAQGASPEAQLYQKTIADQVRGAQEALGGVLTNFKVTSFLKTFPTLANSRSGRRLINEVLSVKNELEMLDSEALKEVYDFYGTENLDPAIARRMADNFKKPQEEALIKKLNEIQPRFEIQQQIEEFRKKLPRGGILIKVTDKDGNSTLNQASASDLESIQNDPQYQFVEVL